MERFYLDQVCLVSWRLSVPKEQIFLEIWEIFCFYLLNILCIFLACSSSPSSMTMILRLGLLMESLSSYIFLSQLLSCLTKISSVFFLSFLLYLLALRFCLLLVLVCWSHVPLWFVWLTGLFISRISVWFSFLRFFISLFSSSFIFCFVFLIHTSLFL
jgi:hypothetical protein